MVSEAEQIPNSVQKMDYVNIVETTVERKDYWGKIDQLANTTAIASNIRGTYKLIISRVELKNC